MLCAQAREAMSAALDGALPVHERTALQLHLADCDGCRQQQRELARVHDVLRAPAARTAGAPRQLHARVRADLARASRATLQRRVVAAVALAAAAGAVALWWPRRPAMVVIGPAVQLEVVTSAGARVVRRTGESLQVGDRVQVDQPFTIMVGQRATVTLRKGARFQLLGDSLFGLDVGGATFAVQPGHQAFRVRTPAGEVTVLGTRFDVDVQGVTTVEVMEGRVRCDSGGGTLVVAAGQRVVMLAGVAPRRGPARWPGERRPQASAGSESAAAASSATGAERERTESSAPGEPTGAPDREGAPATSTPRGEVVAAVPRVTLEGRVELDGPRPPAVLVASPYRVCDARPEQPWEGKDRGLANVHVRVTSPVPPIPDVPRPEITILTDRCVITPRMSIVVGTQGIRIQERGCFVRAQRGGQSVSTWRPRLDQPLFAAPGIYTLSCAPDSLGRATIARSAHPYVAVTREDGTFTIAGLTPGEHTIVAWHEVGGEKTTTVAVGIDGRADPARIVYPAPPPAQVVATPPMGSRSFSECTIVKDTSTPVGRACMEGGKEAAESAMGSLVRAARRLGGKHSCTDCHSDTRDRTLREGARAKLDAMLDAIMRSRH